MRKLTGVIIGAVVLLFGVMPATGVQASTLPGARPYYVVTVGHLDPKTPRTNWVRLAFYRFNTNGTVTEGFWFWSSSNTDELGRVLKVCDFNCTMFGAPHFVSDGPRQLTGTYALNGSTVSILWSTGQREVWSVSTTTRLATMRLLPSSSSYPVTYGQGYGSLRGWSSGATAGQIYDAVLRHSGAAWRLTGVQYQWAYLGPYGSNAVTRSDDFYFAQMSRCTNVCVYMDNGQSTHYFATTAPSLPRKLMRETFMDSHRDSTHCYGNTAHPHLWSGLEVIDDAGAFRGWVSVETSLWTHPQTYTDYMSVGWYTG